MIGLMEAVTVVSTMVFFWLALLYRFLLMEYV
jgi:hypothetical protein